jgi:2'-5' RNA ligase
LNGPRQAAQFALVSYIADPLGKYLDNFRLRLDPGCKPHAHVTILPPRILCGTPEQAVAGIRQLAPEFEPLTVRLGEIGKFPVSNVIYIEISAGREALIEMFRAMNSGAAAFREDFPYHPHITLAQPVPGQDVQALLEDARREWKACPYDRAFRVDTLSFVRSHDRCCWTDIEDIPLRRRPPMGGVTRTGLVEPHLPA